VLRPAWLVAVVVACSPGPPRGEVKPPAPVTRDGILARATGRGGVELRVEQRAGRRLLFIGDTVHAAVPWPPDPSAVDPLVELVRGLRPDARSALVIGLGSGKTAGDLARAGLEVTAVEIEPAVIDLARRYFGYRGRAIAADGLAWMRENEKTFDLLIMDAFAGSAPAPGLVEPAAIRLMRERTAPGGVTAIRLLGSPTDRTVEHIQTRLRATRAGRFFDHMFGSGVAGEVQNLYLVASDAPLSLAAGGGLPLWPIVPGTLDAIAAGRGRQLTVVGYVHRLAGGELALDLAHQEMGAVRYLLGGAGELDAALPRAASFPTEGDIASDGDTSTTLRSVLGGGGTKRSDVRFSPLVAAVSGRARLVAVVHPDAASGVPAAERGDAPTDPRLPWGGALYQLEVSAIHWTLDRAGWRAIASRLAPELAAAVQAIGRGDLAAAASSLERYHAGLEQELGPRGDLLPTHRAVRRWSQATAAEARRAAARGHAFAIAAACDRLHRAVATTDMEPAPRLAEALLACALERYDAVARTDRSAHGFDAAARLLFLLDPSRTGRPMGQAEERKAARRRDQLRQRFSGLLPLEFPPD
jgi:SAM-dependent methyltransferase